MPKDYNNIPRVIEEAERAKETALTAGAVFVMGEAVIRCPVKTGNLRGSLNYKVLTQDNEAIIGTPVHYGIWVETGTESQSAQPYLRPSIDENEQRISNLMAEEYRKAIERGAKH